MTILEAAMRRPRTLGVLCAMCSVALGLAYMASSGAPMRYLATNLGALAIGLTVLLLLGRTGEAGRQWTNGASILIAGALLATALLGVEVDGAARWVNFAGFALQPSLIFLPVLLVAFSRTRSLLATVSLTVAVTAMAVQPDRAMAGMIAVSLAVLALLCRDRASVVALAASLIGFAVTLMRSDMLPASPYVDQILYSSFEVHPAAGLAGTAWIGLTPDPRLCGLEPRCR